MNPQGHRISVRRRLGYILFGCMVALGCGAGEVQHSMVPGFDGVPLVVAQAGNRAGPPILFIHGNSQSTRAWQKQFSDPALVKNFHLVAFDLRGHGASGKPWREDAYTAEAYASDVNAVIKATTTARVVLVPWSYGGNVAMAYVRRFGLDQVAGINIAASRSAFGPSTRRAEMNEQELAKLNKRSTAMRNDDLTENAPATADFVQALTATPLEGHEFREFFTFNMMTPPYVRRAMSTFRPDNRELAARLVVPVLVSHGEADDLVSIKDAQRTHRMIAGSRISTYEGAGHMPFFERPGRFNRELAEFVRAAQ